MFKHFDGCRRVGIVCCVAQSLEKTIIYNSYYHIATYITDAEPAEKNRGLVQDSSRWEASFRLVQNQMFLEELSSPQNVASTLGIREEGMMAKPDPKSCFSLALNCHQ